MQNAFSELWALCDFVYPSYLGASDKFASSYTHPMQLGQRADASASQMAQVRCKGAESRGWSHRKPCVLSRDGCGVFPECVQWPMQAHP
jgi:hypothetical protein